MKRFKAAFNGISTTFKSEQNMKVHFVATIIVIICGILLNISAIEWSLLILSIGTVFAAEIFNTAIEWISNFIEPNHNQKIGAIKDAAAGGVLVLTFSATLIGLIIFIPKITILLMAL